MAAGPIAERNQDATIYVGGLDEKVSETLLWELFLEAGPVGETSLPPFIYPFIFSRSKLILYLFCLLFLFNIESPSSLVKRNVASSSETSLSKLDSDQKTLI